MNQQILYAVQWYDPSTGQWLPCFKCDSQVCVYSNLRVAKEDYLAWAENGETYRVQVVNITSVFNIEFKNIDIGE